MDEYKGLSRQKESNFFIRVVKTLEDDSENRHYAVWGDLLPYTKVRIEQSQLKLF